MIISDSTLTPPTYGEVPVLSVNKGQRFVSAGETKGSAVERSSTKGARERLEASNGECAPSDS